MKRASLVILIILFFLSQPIYSKTIKGLVRDLSSLPLVEVKVILLPSGRIAISDEKGMFKLNLPIDYEKGKLKFSKYGYYDEVVNLNDFEKLKKKEIILIPTEFLVEEISVSALNQEERKISVPMAESKVSKFELKEKISENLVDTLKNTPGVHFIGSGGFKATPTIRGFGRKRVLLLLDGARITSD